MKRFTIRDLKTGQSLPGLESITIESVAFTTYLKALTSRNGMPADLDSLDFGQVAYGEFEISEIQFKAEIVRVK